MSQIVVAGFSITSKVPGFFAATVMPGAGGSPSLFGHKCIVEGQMGTGSTATANTPYRMFTADDATIFGRRSELADMVRAALKNNAEVWAVGIAAPGTPTASTLLFTFAGSWSTAGQITVRMAGRSITFGVKSTNTAIDVSANFTAALNAIVDLPMTSVQGTTPNDHKSTVTVDSTGTRGDLYHVAVDLSAAPAGLTCSMTGGTPVTGGITPFSGGAGTDDVTSLLTALYSAQYDHYGVAQVDSTNLGLFKTQINSKAAATEGRLETVQYCTNKLLTAAASIAQSSLNDTRMNALWCLYSENHPSWLAAFFASYRAATESSNPNPRYLYVPIPGAYPQSQLADIPQNSTLDTALGEGVTPITTMPDGTLAIVRGITTYCKLGAVADTRVLDINQQSMTDYARTRVGAIWTFDISPQFDHVRADPTENEPEPPGNVIYPRLFGDILEHEMKTWLANGWVDSVVRPIVTYNSTGKLLMFDMTVSPTPVNVRTAGNVRQSAA